MTFTITAAPGHHIADVLVDGVSKGAIASHTFTNVTANHTISASFAATAPGTYTITPTAGVHGSISPNTVQVVDSGGSSTFTIAADTGYHISRRDEGRCLDRGELIGDVQQRHRRPHDQRHLRGRCCHHLHDHRHCGRKRLDFAEHGADRDRRCVNDVHHHR